MSLKKNIFFLCMYKMVIISAETQNKAEVAVININENDNVNKLLFKLLCISDVKKRWGGKNLYDLIDKEIKGKYENKNMNDLTKQQITKYKIDSVRLIKSSKHSMYVYEDILIPIIMQSSLSDSKTIKVRTDLGFNQINLILKKRTISVRIINRYIQRKRYTNSIRCFMLRIDLYFYEYKLEIEIDELGHNDRNTDYQIKKKREKKKNLIV